MSRIRFIAIRADELVTWVAMVLVVFGLVGCLALLRTEFRHATPVPRAILWRSLPTSTASEPPQPTATVGALAPEFTLSDASGKILSLSSYKGKPVLLYFWATWCTFCREDMPELEQLRQTEGDTELVILAINLLEKPGAVAAFGQQLGLTLPLLLDSEGTVSAIYLVRATPTYYFIDRDGVVRSQIVGRPRPIVLERNLNLILESEKPQGGGAEASAGLYPLHLLCLVSQAD